MFPLETDAFLLDKCLPGFLSALLQLMLPLGVSQAILVQLFLRVLSQRLRLVLPVLDVLIQLNLDVILFSDSGVILSLQQSIVVLDTMKLRG